MHTAHLLLLTVYFRYVDPGQTRDTVESQTRRSNHLLLCPACRTHTQALAAGLRLNTMQIQIYIAGSAGAHSGYYSLWFCTSAYFIETPLSPSRMRLTHLFTGLHGLKLNEGVVQAVARDMVAAYLCTTGSEPVERWKRGKDIKTQIIRDSTKGTPTK